MKAFTIGKNDAGQRLDRFVSKAAPQLPLSLRQKYIRCKRIKVNGSRAQEGQRLKIGDLVEMYVNDEFFNLSRTEYPILESPKLNIVFEDENILLCDKKQGQSVYPHNGEEQGKSLLDHVQAYLYEKGAWNPKEENTFAPALCNRLDRNTGGIVIAAKNAETLRIINEKIKNREICKRYLAVVHGIIQPREGTLRGYFSKDSRQNRVFAAESGEKGAKYCETRYRTLAFSGNLSLVECELVTGRTHQIRAQFADAGCPILGDRKYGKDVQKYQALYAYDLTFAFQGDAGRLQYLNGRNFRVETVDFAETYFPGVIAFPPQR